MLIAALDTSVLYPSLQRDLLLSFAVEGLYRPVWGSAVLDELERHEELKLIARSRFSAPEARRRAARLLAQMRLTFPDAEIRGWERLDGTFGLPDRDDEHVVAAAVTAGAGVIVTSNQKDFPAERLPSPMTVQPPADFAHEVVLSDLSGAFRAVQEIVKRSGHFGPEMSAASILEILEERYNMTNAVELLRSCRSS